MEATDYLKPYKRLLVDVTASKGGIEKALKFGNALFTALEAKKYRVAIAEINEGYQGVSVDEREERIVERRGYFGYGRWSPMRPTILRLHRIVFGLSIIEMSGEAQLRYVNGSYMREDEVAPHLLRMVSPRHTWTTTREIPSGRLKLVAYSPYPLVQWQTEWQETPRKPLDKQIPAIIRSLESEAGGLHQKLEEARRLAEIERRKREKEWERYRRQEDQRLIAQSHKESREHLNQVIQQWAEVMNMQRFFEGVEARAANLSERDRDAILQRLKLAREVMGSPDPLDFLRIWKSPAERYEPRYQNEESGSEIL